MPNGAPEQHPPPASTLCMLAEAAADPPALHPAPQDLGIAPVHSDILQQHSADSRGTMDHSNSIMPSCELQGHAAARRKAGARLLAPGFIVPQGNLKLVQWPEGASKPALSESREEILIRNPSARCKHWTLDKCTNELLGLPHDCATSKSCESSNAAKKNWSKIRDGPRLANCIIASKEEFLSRDKKKDRQDIDAGEIDPYWSKVAILFNDKDNLDVNCNRHPEEDEFDDFVFEHSGFVGTSKSLRSKHNDFRGDIEHGLVGYRRSGKFSFLN